MQIATTALQSAFTGAAAASVAAELAALAEVNRIASAAQAIVHATGTLEQCDKARAINKAQTQAQADVKAEPSEAALSKKQAAAAATRPLIDRISKFESGDANQFHNLVSFPPNFQAGMCYVLCAMCY